MEAIWQFKDEYRWLSNFWPCRIEMDGEIYPSVEHAYQAAKSLRPYERQKVREAETPGLAKRLGKTLTIRPDWEEVKIKVMLSLVRQKFTRDPELQRKLLETGDTLLFEGNYWGDRFWGIDLKTLEGENHLGKILMRVREELKRKRAPLVFEYREGPRVDQDNFLGSLFMASFAESLQSRGEEE